MSQKNWREWPSRHTARTGRSASRRRRERRERLRLELLEDRTLLSTLNIDAGGNLTYVAAAGVSNNLRVFVEAPNYRFTDDETINLTGQGTAAWTGGGTVSVTGPTSSVNAITSIDLGDGANNEFLANTLNNNINSLTAAA